MFMKFNVEQGKSMDLLEIGEVQIARCMTNGDFFRETHSYQYLSVGNTVREAAPRPMMGIVDGK